MREPKEPVAIEDFASSIESREDFEEFMRLLLIDFSRTGEMRVGRTQHWIDFWRRFGPTPVAWRPITEIAGKA